MVATTLEQPAEVRRLARQATLRRTSTDGLSVVWRSWGEGPCVVLLHGGHGAWTHWISNISQLAQAFRIVVPDMPGFGESDGPCVLANLEDYARLLSHALDNYLGRQEPLFVVGFSFGAATAAYLLEHQHRRVRRLVLVGANRIGGLVHISGLRQWRSSTSPADLLSAHRHNLHRLMFADPKNIDELALSLQAINSARARLQTRGLTGRSDLLGCLQRYPVPLGGIWGAEDALAAGVLDRRRHALREADPDLRFQVIAGAGHWVQYEQSERFNEALLSMMA